MQAAPSREDTAEEGLRLARAARDAGIPLRLFGGVAIWSRCPSAREGSLRLSYADIDLVTLGRATKAVSAFLEADGYEPDRLFNALHGASRMTFADPVRRRPIDVIVDRFQMCHTIDLRDRFESDELTLPLADLLLTKLQVVQLNDKDVRDSLAILADHPVDQDGPDVVGLERIRELTSNDWGFEHTIRGTLHQLRQRLGDYGLTKSIVSTIEHRIDALIAALDSAPKGLRWRLRAQVGERVRWYELPEEARR
jgi:hypothetical protein